MIKVAITEFEYNKAATYFDSVPDFEWVVVPSGEEALAAAVRASGARHAVVGTVKYTGELYRALPRGGVIARFGVGHDGIDKALAARHGLFCINTPGELDRSVAEFGIGAMIAAARHIGECSTELHGGCWHNRLGTELFGKRLLIVGCGEIGTRLARIACHGFEMKVTGLVRTLPGEPLPPFEALHTDFAEAVKDADFISIHIPDTPENRNFISREKLALCKKTAILINTARGAVLDEDALYDALAGGVIAGAALDVFATEPYEPRDAAKDLRKLPQLLLTPHLGSSTAAACVRVARRVVENLRAAEAGDFQAMDLLRVPQTK